MPELQQLNPDAYRLLRRIERDYFDEEGAWNLCAAEHVGEDV